MTDSVSLAVARAKKKLREARFFLTLMRGEDRSRSDSEIFGYYASAFLSATISAFYVLRDTAAAKVFRAWWRERKLSPEERQLWNLMFGVRDSEVHDLGTVRSRTAGPALRAAYVIAGQKEPAPDEDVVTPEWSATSWRFEDRVGRGEADIVPLAEALLSLWERLVDAFEDESKCGGPV